MKKTWILALCLAACMPDHRHLKTAETGKTDSVYYQDLSLADNSDVTLLKALYGEVLERSSGLVGIYLVLERPTTRLEPYPPDSTLARIHQRCNYSDKGLQKQLVVLKLEHTDGNYYSDFHFVLLAKHSFRWTIESVWYEQTVKKDPLHFALHQGKTDSLELDLYAGQDSILKSYMIFNEVMTEKPKGLLEKIDGRTKND